MEKLKCRKTIHPRWFEYAPRFDYDLESQVPGRKVFVGFHQRAKKLLWGAWKETKVPMSSNLNSTSLWRSWPAMAMTAVLPWTARRLALLWAWRCLKNFWGSMLNNAWKSNPTCMAEKAASVCEPKVVATTFWVNTSLLHFLMLG